MDNGKLDMDHEKKLERPEAADITLQTEEASKETGTERPTRGLEGFYENFRAVPLKYIDAFIIICIVLLIAVIAVGVVKARV